MTFYPATNRDVEEGKIRREENDANIKKRDEALGEAGYNASRINDFAGTDNDEARRLAAVVIVDLNRYDRLQACIANYYNNPR